jgi:DNA-binding MarR family transcriptional regulator
VDRDTQHARGAGGRFDGTAGIGETTVLQILRVADLLTRVGDSTVFHKELTQAQFNVLMILKRHGEGGMSQKDILAKLVCSKGNVSIHTANLTRMGYIRKKISQTDSRVNVITLTAKGRRVLAHLEPRYLQQLNDVTRDLPREQAERVVELLAHLEEKCHAALGGMESAQPEAGKP